MWSRKELKAKGKAAFKANYWRCVLVGLIIAVLLGSGAATVNSSARRGADNYAQEAGVTAELDVNGRNMFFRLDEAIKDLPPEQQGAIVLAVAGAVCVGMVIFSIIHALIFNPLEVGCRRFYLVNAEKPASLSEVAFGYEHNFKNQVLALLLRDVYIVLWCLLCIIPGIVKAYSYRLVPYIMAENPEMKPKEALALSRELMNGNKWKTFVLDLSFLGWIILSGFTFGILYTLYVGPYTHATDAELCRAIRDGSTDIFGV